MSGAAVPRLDAISPFFVVADVARAVAFYRDGLGFDLRFAEPVRAPFFAIVGRDGAQLLLKSEAGLAPLANPQRHSAMRWDAFVHTAEPDELAAEFTSRGVALAQPLSETRDGLRGFEVTDPDGYTLFFGRPR